MTVCTHGSLRRAVLRRLAVNALLVGRERLRAHSSRTNNELLPMASPAGRRNMRMAHRRLRIIGRHDLVHISVATRARRRWLASLVRTCMIAPPIRRHCVCVTLRTLYLARRRHVRRLFDVRMAIHAREHRPVHGVFHLAAIDEEADRLSVYIFRQRLVLMTGEAFFVFDLVMRLRRHERRKRQCEKYSAANPSSLHA